MDLEKAVRHLEGDRFVYADAAHVYVASGRDVVDEGGFDVVDRCFASDVDWCVRADFAGRVTAFRPRMIRRMRRAAALPLADDDVEFAVDSASDAAARAAYQGNVAAAVSAIDAGEFEKLVVARQVHLTVDGGVDVPRLAQALLSHDESCVYVVDLGGGSILAGASPEQLLRRDGDVAFVDCVAGTRLAGDGWSLFESDKDRREHQLVVDGVVEAIGGAPSHLRLIHRGHLCHLGNSVKATVTTPPSTQLAALHPTAATAGRPRERATAWLRDHEGFDRGVYGGFVGVVGQQRASLAVVLRGAVICGDDVVVTVGAGIVRGSDPAKEWQETAHKARVLWPALAAARNP